jgi:hypothetical protein
MKLCDYCKKEIVEIIHPNAAFNLFPRVDPDNPNAFQPTQEVMDFHDDCMTEWIPKARALTKEGQ